MKNIFWIASFLLVMLTNNIANAQDDKFKALMIYNFTRVTGWPDDYLQGNFIITVLGESAVFDELNNIAQSKKVGIQTIEVKKISSAGEITRSHILYVPSGQNALLPEVLKKTKDNGTLIISEKKGLTDPGACINFFAEDGQLKYQVHVANLKSKGLKPSTSLTSPENAVQIN